MSKHDRDPALRALVRSLEETAQATVPVRLTVRGSVLRGRLVGQQRYFTELAERHPMMGALDPDAGLVSDGKYAKDVADESGYHLHLIDGRLAAGGTGEGELWRIRLSAVDGWALALDDDEEDGKPGRGHFAGVLGTQ